MARPLVIPLPLERATFLPTHAFSLDSVQGYLELALRYPTWNVTFHCDPSDTTKLHSMYFQLTQLEKEGYVVLKWVAGKVDDGLELLELKQIALTTSGHKLLGELRAKSRLGKVKERLSTILWAAASSVVTTLVVLAVKGA